MGITQTYHAGLREGLTELMQGLAHTECSVNAAIIVTIKHNDMNTCRASGQVLAHSLQSVNVLTPAFEDPVQPPDHV